jgi:hypothetical protein
MSFYGLISGIGLKIWIELAIARAITRGLARATGTNVIRLFECKAAVPWTNPCNYEPCLFTDLNARVRAMIKR